MWWSILLNIVCVSTILNGAFSGTSNEQYMEIFRDLVRAENVSGIEELLLRPNIKLTDDVKTMSWEWAVKNAHEKIFTLLLDNGVNVNLKNQHGQTALHLATINGSLNFVLFLIKHKAKVNLLDDNRKTALHYASEYGYTDVVKLLIDSCASLNIKDMNSERTALHYAAVNGNEHIANLLISNGANLNLQGKYGETSFDLATAYGNENILGLIRKAKIGIAPQDIRGCMPLNGAVKSGNIKRAKELIEHEDINGLDNDGNAAIHLAVKIEQSQTKSNIEIVDLLLKNHANVNLTNNDLKTALHLTTEEGDADIANRLLQNFANINLKDKNGCTALHRSSEYDREEITKLLIKYGADINAVDNYGNTPLILAALKGRTKIVEILLKNVADVKIKNFHGSSALNSAHSSGNVNIVEILKRYKNQMQ